jgi:type IV secretory pathway VirB2 component (pilin)
MKYRSSDQPDFGKGCTWRLTTLALILAPAQALAAGSTGSLPWDGPLQTLAADLTGPVATSISVIALFVAGAVLVFGEDLGHFARRALVAVIAIAFLLLGSQFLIALGLTNG